jgi:BMFP domain-containing protein YqiC
MANDIFSTLRTYLNKVTDEKNASEVASSVNQWFREGGEALKIKIEDEVERSVSKMGFVKRGEFEALKEEVARLKMVSPTSDTTKNKTTAKKSATKKASSEKAAPKKSAVKKSAVKKASK